MDVQRAFRFMPSLILVIRPDADFTIVSASDAYLKATHTDTGIFGRPVFDVFPDNPGDSQATEPQRYDIRQPGSSHFEERYWTSVNSPVLDAQGRLEYIVQTTEPATARGRRDAIAILESITEGFFTLDRQWRFDYVNSEAHRILGKEPGELSGQELWQAYPGLEGTDFERNYRRSMLDREKTSFTAYYAAQQRWYEVTTFPAPEGVSVFFRNVTGQKSLQAERETLMAESERASAASMRPPSTARRILSTSSTWTTARSMPTTRCSRPGAWPTYAARPGSSWATSSGMPTCTTANSTR